MDRLNWNIVTIFIIFQWMSSVNTAELNATNENNFTSSEYHLPITDFEEFENVSSTELSNMTESEILADCVAFPLSPGEYTMFDNGTAYVENYNKSYDPSAYILDGDILIVCAPMTEIEEIDPDSGINNKFSLAFTYITCICLGISIFCLILHLVIFFVVPDMRNLPGYNLASLCFSLLFGYVFFMVAHATDVENAGVLCIGAALGMQFFMLSSFLWMSTIALDVYRSLLKATGKLRLASRKFSCKKYSMYCAYSWGTSLIFVVVTLVLDNLDGIHEEFRPMIGVTVCWFSNKTPLIMLFAAPVIAVVISNMVLFGLSARIIYANRMRMDGDEAYKSMLKKNFLMHGRLATIMGLAWFVSIIANIVNANWLWYIYVLLNTLQGFFIFLAFTCTHKVKKYLQMRLNSRKRKISTQSSSPTFQSYWNTAFSVEQDSYLTSESNIGRTEIVGQC